MVKTFRLNFDVPSSISEKEQETFISCVLLDILLKIRDEGLGYTKYNDIFPPGDDKNHFSIGTWRYKDESEESC